jgi:uncharacterized phage protein (TIGR01671 family)
MKREILFRGKRRDSKEWIYGSLIDFRDGDFAITVKSSIPTWAIVQPETVGQYSGIKDKNGSKIFEGDIVERDDMRVPQEIIFHYGTFREKDTDTISSTSWKVIGNIHDNPELP